MTYQRRSNAFNPIVFLLYPILIFSIGCDGRKSLSDGLAGDTDLDGNGLMDGAFTDPGAAMGTGSLGTLDYAGNGNQLPTSEEMSYLAELQPQVQAMSPQAATPFPPAVITGLQKVQAMEANGEDTTAARMALAGQMLSACGQDASRLAPRPGEPLLGNWVGACTSGDSVVLAASVTAQYPGTSGGIPAGDPKLSIVAIGSTGSTAAGSIKVYPDGNADATVQAEGSVWAGKMTDQPQAATGVLVPVSGSSKCKQVKGQLVKSRNPIPAKYQEAVKRLGQCYRQAITVISPILSGYVYHLTSQAGQQVVGALKLQ